MAFVRKKKQQQPDKINVSIHSHSSIQMGIHMNLFVEIILFENPLIQVNLLLLFSRLIWFQCKNHHFLHRIDTATVFNFHHLTQIVWLLVSYKYI